MMRPQPVFAERAVELDDQLLRPVVAVEVRAERLRLAARFPDGSDHGLRPPAAGAIVYEHAGTVPREAASDGGTDAAGPSGDEGEFVGERQVGHGSGG